MRMGRISNMDKEIIKKLDERLNLVDSRLGALETEKAELLIEQKLLQNLTNHYEMLKYDSIEEERRVTENILEPKPQVYTNSRVYNTKYEKIFKDIYFTKDYIGLTSRELTSEVEKVVKTPVRLDSISHTINRFVTQNKAYKSDGLYYWVCD